MSNFLQYKKLIAEGDTVIVCRVSWYNVISHHHSDSLATDLQGRDKYLPVEVRRGEVIQVRGGAVHHSSLIGREYGSKVGGASSSDEVGVAMSSMYIGADIQWEELGGSSAPDPRTVDAGPASQDTDTLRH